MASNDLSALLSTKEVVTGMWSTRGASEIPHWSHASAGLQQPCSARAVFVLQTKLERASAAVLSSRGFRAPDETQLHKREQISEKFQKMP